MKEMWNQRFAANEFVYGKEPNKYFKDKLEKLTPGKLLLLGEGEGRNAVFAAKLGWQVDAIDWSEKGKEKTTQFASENNVTVNYTVADLSEYMPPSDYYDTIGLVFLHLPPELRENVHKNVVTALKPGGKVILEAYEKDQIKNNSGGPKNLDMLYSLEEIYTDFRELDIDHFAKENIILEESRIHNGSAEVIRFCGTKLL